MKLIFLSFLLNFSQIKIYHYYNYSSLFSDLSKLFHFSIFGNTQLSWGLAINKIFKSRLNFSILPSSLFHTAHTFPTSSQKHISEISPSSHNPVTKSAQTFCSMKTKQGTSTRLKQIFPTDSEMKVLAIFKHDLNLWKNQRFPNSQILNLDTHL